MTDPVIAESIKLRDGLRECANEFRIRSTLEKGAAGRELARRDQATCESAAKMMQKLGTEVTRLRLSIQHFGHGRMSRADLLAAAENWNCDPPHLRQP